MFYVFIIYVTSALFHKAYAIYLNENPLKELQYMYYKIIMNL